MAGTVWVVEKTWYEFGSNCNFSRFELFASEKKAYDYVDEKHPGREALNGFNNVFGVPDHEDEYSIMLHIYERKVA